MVSSKEEKSDKKESDTNFVGIIVTIIFVQKYFSSSSESLLQCYSLTLKTQNRKKAICRMPSIDPRQLQAH